MQGRVQGSKLQEYGSEVEDMLSGEISLDRFYSKLIQKISSSDKVNSNDIMKLSNLKLVAHKALYTAYFNFLFTNEFDRTHMLLRGLWVICDRQASQSLRNIIAFEVHRAHALGFYKEFKYMQAVKELNPAIASCPSVGGGFANSLADTLVLLTECYSAIGRREDALHSARLAVKIAQERIEKQKQHGELIVDEYDEFEGPLLDSVQSQILSYCSLAAELERSGAGNSASDLYKRAYQVGNKYNADKEILQELVKLIDLSGAQLSIGNLNNHDQQMRTPAESWAPSPSAYDNTNHVRGPSSSGPSTFSERGDRSSGSGQSSSPARQNKEYSMAAMENTAQQMSFANGRARPQSALPRLVQNQGNGDGWNMLPDHALTTGGAANIAPMRDDHSRRKGDGTYGNENYDAEAMRPKSAVSKLGGSYSHPVTAVPSSQEYNNSIPTTPQSGNQHSDSTRPSQNNIKSTTAARPPQPGVASIGHATHSIILLPPSPAASSSSSKKKPSVEVPLPVASSGAKNPVTKREKAGVESISAQSVPSKVAGIAVDHNLERPSQSNHSMSQELLPNGNSRSFSQPSDQSNSLPPPAAPSSTTKTNKTPISKAMLFAHIHQQEAQLENRPAPATPGKKRTLAAAANAAALNTTHLTTNTQNNPNGNTINKSQPPNPLLTVDEHSREKLKRISHALFPYFKGMAVEAKYQVHRLGDRGRWYPGRIIKADFVNGLYDVEFDNGDREKNVFVDNIRIPEHASKMALLQQRGGKQSQTIAAQKPQDDDNNTTDKRSLPARVIRKQNIEDMHTHIKKLLAGVNQRTDIRKIERVSRKNTCMTRIQALVRGVLCRHRFPKIRHQLTKEIALLRKEKELQALEAKILARQFLSEQLQDYLTQQIEEEDEFLQQKAMELMVDKQARQLSAEIQTGGSLVWEDEVPAEDLPITPAEDRMAVEEIALVEPVGRFMSRPMLSIPPPTMDSAGYLPSGGVTGNGMEYLIPAAYPEPTPSGPTVDHNTYLQYLQQYQDSLATSEYQQSMKLTTIEDALSKVQNEQRGLIAFEQERTQMLAYQLDGLKEAMMAQQEAFRQLQAEEEKKRQLLEEQLVQLLQSRTAASPSPPPPVSNTLPPPSATIQMSTSSPPSVIDVIDVDEPKPSTSTTLPATNLLERSVEEEGVKGLTLGEHSSFLLDPNALQLLQIEEFWNSVASGDFPASLRPSTLLNGGVGSEPDDEVLQQDSVLQPLQVQLPSAAVSPIPVRASVEYVAAPREEKEEVPPAEDREVTTTSSTLPSPPHPLVSACTDNHYPNSSADHLLNGAEEVVDEDRDEHEVVVEDDVVGEQEPAQMVAVEEPQAQPHPQPSVTLASAPVAEPKPEPEPEPEVVEPSVSTLPSIPSELLLMEPPVQTVAQTASPQEIGKVGDESLSLELDGLGIQEVEESEGEAVRPQPASSPLLRGSVGEKSTSQPPSSHSFTMQDVTIDDFWGSANSLYNELIPMDSVHEQQESEPVVMTVVEEAQPSSLSPPHPEPEPEVPQPRQQEEAQEEAAASSEMLRQSVESVTKDFARSFEAKIEELLHAFPLGQPAGAHRVAPMVVTNCGRDAKVEMLLDTDDEDDDEEEEEDDEEELIVEKVPLNDTPGEDMVRMEEKVEEEVVEEPTDDMVDPSTEEADEKEAVEDAKREEGEGEEMQPEATVAPPVVDQEEGNPTDEGTGGEEVEEAAEELEEMTSPLPVFSNHIWPDQSYASLASLSQSQSFLPSANQTLDTSGLYSHLKDAERLELYLDNHWPADISTLDHQPEAAEAPIAPPLSGSPMSLTVSPQREKSEVLDSQALFALSLMEEEEPVAGTEDEEVGKEEVEGEEQGGEDSAGEVELANLVILPRNEEVDLYDSLPSPVFARQPSNLARQYVQEPEREEEEDDDEEDDDRY